MNSFNVVSDITPAHQNNILPISVVACNIYLLIIKSEAIFSKKISIFLNLTI